MGSIAYNKLANRTSGSGSKLEFNKGTPERRYVPGAGMYWSGRERRVAALSTGSNWNQQYTQSRLHQTIAGRCWSGHEQDVVALSTGSDSH